MNMQNKFNMQSSAQSSDSYKADRFRNRELSKTYSKKTRELAGRETYCFLLLILNQEPRILVPARYKNT